MIEILETIKTLLEKSFLIMLFMSVLFIIRHIFLFTKHINSDEIRPYQINNKDIFYLGLSLSYILMVIFNGIGL